MAENDPQWYKDAVIYELHVRSFYDSDGDGIGDFKGLISKLDYLQNLGVTALWLLPFYTSPLKDDGYDISDYFGVHHSYGTMSVFREFLKQAHSRGLRVITELVINHTSDQHKWFQEARRAPKGSKQRDYYVWSDSPEKYRDARVIFRDFESSNWAWDPVARAYYWHRFYSHQPDLNFDNPDVHEAVFEAIDFWLGLGVDGLRLDAVPYLYEREGTNCENLPETHAFLKKLRKHVDERFKDRMLLAEANQWSEDAVKYFGENDECHMAFNFPVMPRMFMSIQLEDRFPLVDILEGAEKIPKDAQWAMFLRNHDELTLEMVTDEERDSMYRFYATDPKAKINFGIRRRLAPLLWNNPRKIEIMNVLLFSLPGTPVIYYGDEICMGDNYYLGDRNGVRTPMQWSSYRNAGFSEANPQQLYLPVIIDPEYHYESVNVENQEKNLSSPLWWMKRVIAMRKQYRAFGRGRMKMFSPQNPKVLAFIREYEDEKILVVINMSRFSQMAELDLSAYDGMIPVEVFSHNRFRQISREPYVFTLGPYNYFWFSLENAGKPAEGGEEIAPAQLVFTGKQGDFPALRKKLENQVLAPYMRRCRWFGGKGRHVRKITITDSVDLVRDEKMKKIAVIDVMYTEGRPEKYFLPIFYEEGENAKKIRDEFPKSVIASVRNGAAEGVLYDGAYSREFHSMMFNLVEKHKKIKAGKGYFSGKQSPAFKKIIKKHELPLVSYLFGAEQTNTSIAFGSAFVMKIYRHAENGENPDIEIMKALEKRLVSVPALAGYADFCGSSGEKYNFAKLESYTENEGDAWKFASDNVIKYFDRVMSRREELEKIASPGAGIGAEEKEVLFKTLCGEFFINMTQLIAKRTGELHLALSSVPGNHDFAPEPFTVLYQRSVYQAMKNSLNNSFRLLEKNLSLLDAPFREEAEAALGMKEKIDGILRKIAEKKIDTMRTRIHGDLHLGQALFSGNDFTIIDFEGEPARTLGERRLKRSPLRDAAGMMRSFHYAAHASLIQHPSVRPEDKRYLEPWAETWYEYVSGKFLEAYLDTVKGACFIPESEGDLRIMLDAYVADKAIYELGYEANNRPAWIAIPVKGLKNILGIK